MWGLSHIIQFNNDSVTLSITMALASYSVLGTNYMQVFDDRLRRIVEECYEVAFIVCNSDMEEFTTAKVFDVFNQTFPTAYVLNTGYWPFYSTIKGQSLCVCGRFGIPCRHVKSDFHWIDISPIDNDASTILFQPKAYGFVFPQEYQINIKTFFDEGIHGCNINALINVHYKRNERGRFRRERMSKVAREQLAPTAQKDVYNKIFNITLIAGFYMRPEFYSAVFTIVFQPSPFFHEQYATYFKNLKHLRAAEFANFRSEQQQIWYITCPQMATSTFVLHHVNVAIYKQPSQVMVYYPYYIKAKGLRAKRNKSCQTTEDNVSRIGESSNIWNYSADHAQSISCALVNLASTAVKETTQNISQEPFVIEDSESFDNQWPVVGHSKVIQPNCSKTDILIETPGKLYKIQAFKTISNNSEPRGCDTSSNSLPSTSTANSSSEPDSTTGFTNPQPSLPVSIPVRTTSPTEFPSLVPIDPKPVVSNMDFSKAVKNPPPNCEKNVPSMEVAAEVVVKTEIDEEFELIETVIWEDVMKKEDKWWEVEPHSPPNTNVD